MRFRGAPLWLLCAFPAGAGSSAAREPASLAPQGDSGIALARMATGHLTLRARTHGVIGAQVPHGGAGGIDHAGGMLHLTPRAGTAATATTTSETPQR